MLLSTRNVAFNISTRAFTLRNVDATLTSTFSHLVPVKIESNIESNVEQCKHGFMESLIKRDGGFGAPLSLGIVFDGNF